MLAVTATLDLSEYYCSYLFIKHHLEAFSIFYFIVEVCRQIQTLVYMLLKSYRSL